MADEEHGASFFARHLAHLAEAFLLERRVANGEHFVDDENFRIEMCRDREGEPNVHAAAVALHRRVEKLLDFGERHDFIEASVDLVTAHTENRAVQINVFAAREFGMKTGADFEETADPPIEANLAFGGIRDA